MNLDRFRKKEFERREQKLKNATALQLQKKSQKKLKLHIVYVMTWTEVCGGSKIILEHANRLVNLGQDVTIISHFNKPLWFSLDEKVKFIQVPFHKILCESIPKCDIIVATYWREIYECIEQKIAPVIYFEQGDSHLFDTDDIDERTMQHIRKQFSLAPFVFTVSNFAKEQINKQFNKEAIVIPNAVDENIFYPQKKDKNNKDKTVITIIGSEDSSFKCIDNILEAIRILKNDDYNIELKWITPTKPSKNKEKAIVNPKQIIIGDILRQSDIYICASIYESFCLPVLEAMTCGTAVITTDNGGIRDFVKDNENALIVEKNNIQDIISKIKIVIENNDIKEKLSKNAIITSKKFSWDITTKKLLDYYFEISDYILL